MTCSTLLGNSVFLSMGGYRSAFQTDKESSDEIQGNYFSSRRDLAGCKFGECQGFTRSETGEDKQDGNRYPGGPV